MSQQTMQHSSEKSALLVHTYTSPQEAQADCYIVARPFFFFFNSPAHICEPSSYRWLIPTFAAIQTSVTSVTPPPLLPLLLSSFFSWVNVQVG